MGLGVSRILLELTHGSPSTSPHKVSWEVTYFLPHSEVTRDGLRSLCLRDPLQDPSSGKPSC